MSIMPRPHREGERGQALVIMVAAMIAALAMVALIVDGGNAWAQQRITQNGTDASANAGATVLAKRLAGQAAPVLGWDSAVDAAVTATAADNGIGLSAAYYTDICGVMLKLDGTKATSTSNAAQVGNGQLPIDLGITPDCPSGVVGPVAGVRALGNKPFNTYVAGVIGLTSLDASADATSVTGFLQGVCEGNTEDACALLPVTAPVTVTSCDQQNNAVITADPWPKDDPAEDPPTIVPLCRNGPGNVGWIDWDPPNGGIPDIIDSISTPDNPAIDLPSWQYVVQTGNTNAKQLEDAINVYHRKIVLFPLFDLTCSSDPDDTKVTLVPTYGCPANDVGGNGNQQWYRFPQFAAFLLDYAYLNGNNQATCEQNGNGATSCLTGWFVNFITTGTVGPGIGGGQSTSSIIGVQLIK